MKKQLLTCFGLFGILIIICIPNCRNAQDADIAKFKIITEISSNQASPFYINFKQYPSQRKSLPIGIFDSGTGGLTVLDSIVKIDRYNNQTKVAEPDGLPDFQNQKFIYLGDKANMPYGRYQAEEKADFLRELVIKDIQFLLGNTYYPSPHAANPRMDKQQVKAIVIACNTATAYGFDLIGKALQVWKLDVPVMGIIDAGVKRAIEQLPALDDKFTVVIMATEGTCATGGYPKAFKKYHEPKFKSNGIAIVQQAGFGLAAAIDGDLNYIDARAKEVRGKGEYFGPKLNHPQYTIDLTLWPEYNFSEQGLLIKRDLKGEMLQVQLNSVDNYIKYHVTHLVQKTIVKFPQKKLRTIILGCTHYPFYTKEIQHHLAHLRKLNKKYADLIPDDLNIIDPADALAVELYERLVQRQLLAKKSLKESQFYISVANKHLSSNQIDDNGDFAFSYKYGRSINQSLRYVKRVPFGQEWMKADILNRIKIKMPAIFGMIFKNKLQHHP